MGRLENKRVYNKRSGVVYDGVETGVRGTQTIEERETEPSRCPSLPFEFLWVLWRTKTSVIIDILHSYIYIDILHFYIYIYIDILHFIYIYVNILHFYIYISIDILHLQTPFLLKPIRDFQHFRGAYIYFFFGMYRNDES